MKWIAWGLRVVDGEQEKYIVGKLDCPNAIAALAVARMLYNHLTVDHVQSVLSYEVDLLETHHKLVSRRHHPRRKPEKLGPFGEALNGAGTLNNLMSSGNSPLPKGLT